MVKIISFDLDGTLATEDFDDVLWNTEIPMLYSRTHNVSLESAKKHVFSEYYKALYIEKVKDWTNLNYWSERLQLDVSLIYEDMKKKVSVYEEVISVLEYLKEKYDLIVVTNASEEFMNIKLEIEDLKKYFTHTFSAPKISETEKKDVFTYKKIIDLLGITAEEIIHVGDNAFFDKQVPESIGIKSYLLDRQGLGDIKSLEELKKLL